MGRGRGLWEDGTDGAVKEKGWGFCVSEDGEWGGYTIDLQLRGTTNGFSSESQGCNVRDEWLRPREKTLMNG